MPQGIYMLVTRGKFRGMLLHVEGEIFTIFPSQVALPHVTVPTQGSSGHQGSLSRDSGRGADDRQVGEKPCSVVRVQPHITNSIFSLSENHELQKPYKEKTKAPLGTILT